MGSTSGTLVVLSFGESLIGVSGEDAEQLQAAGALDAFRARGNATLKPDWMLLRAGSKGGAWTDFEPGSGAAGGYRPGLEGIEVHPDTNAMGLSLALRGLFSRAIERRGGVLVHAAGVTWNGRAALITGASGAGKSTLARWSVTAGATLLSDEVVGVLPDGSVYGTPFRSDSDLQGTPAVARLHLATTLRHGTADTFDAVPTHELIAVLCEQAFHRDREISAGQVLRCIARAVEGVETTRFTCRNSAAAGEALRARLLEGSP